MFYWLLLSLFLFSVGIYGFLTRRSSIGLLISVEIIINAAALIWIVFNRFIYSQQVDGHVMVLLMMAVAASEVLVAISILVMLFRKKHSTDITKLNQLRH